MFTSKAAEFGRFQINPIKAQETSSHPAQSESRFFRVCKRGDFYSDSIKDPFSSQFYIFAKSDRSIRHLRISPFKIAENQSDRTVICTTRGTQEVEVLIYFGNHEFKENALQCFRDFNIFQTQYNENSLLCLRVNFPSAQEAMDVFSNRFIFNPKTNSFERILSTPHAKIVGEYFDSTSTAPNFNELQSKSDLDNSNVNVEESLRKAFFYLGSTEYSYSPFLCKVFNLDLTSLSQNESSGSDPAAWFYCRIESLKPWFSDIFESQKESALTIDKRLYLKIEFLIRVGYAPEKAIILSTHPEISKFLDRVFDQVFKGNFEILDGVFLSLKAARDIV